MLEKLPSYTIAARGILKDRLFNEIQINNILPKLKKEVIESPTRLKDTINMWNSIFGNAVVNTMHIENDITVATSSPKKSIIRGRDIDMNDILGRIEPNLLNMNPNSIYIRKNRLDNLNVFNNLSQHWTVLYHAPRGFYLQDWKDFIKKFYYIDEKVIDLLYDKKQTKNMQEHPLIKAAAAIELDFDEIRTRYLFALRSGYKQSDIYTKVASFLERPSLRDLLLTRKKTYLEKFSPYCTLEEFECFSDLIQNSDLDEEDSKIYEKLAELNDLSYVKKRT